MKHINKIFSLFLLLTFAMATLSCQEQKAVNSNNASNAPAAATVKAESPTEAFKLLFAAVKSKDPEQIKQIMSKGTLAFAEGYAAQTKQTLNKALENGFTAPTLADSLPEIRDERIKDNFGAVEVFNLKDNRWEDLPFVLEDGGWKLAVGDVFQDTFKSPGKSRGETEREASNTMTPMPTNMTQFPEVSNGNKSVKTPSASDSTKSVEVPKQDKQKQ
jgi:hypothetical protein